MILLYALAAILIIPLVVTLIWIARAPEASSQDFEPHASDLKPQHDLPLAH